LVILLTHYDISTKKIYRKYNLYLAIIDLDQLELVLGAGHWGLSIAAVVAVAAVAAEAAEAAEASVFDIDLGVAAMVDGESAVAETAAEADRMVAIAAEVSLVDAVDVVGVAEASAGADNSGIVVAELVVWSVENSVGLVDSAAASAPGAELGSIVRLDFAVVVAVESERELEVALEAESAEQQSPVLAAVQVAPRAVAVEPGMNQVEQSMFRQPC
jgi:hypothetical protein